MKEAALMLPPTHRITPNTFPAGTGSLRKGGAGRRVNRASQTGMCIIQTLLAWAPIKRAFAALHCRRDSETAESLQARPAIWDCAGPASSGQGKSLGLLRVSLSAPLPAPRRTSGSWGLDPVRDIWRLSHSMGNEWVSIWYAQPLVPSSFRSPHACDCLPHPQC